MKLILPDHLIADIEPHLPSDIDVVEVDSEGNLDGDASDAEVYVNGFYLKASTHDKVLAAAPRLRWQQSPSAGVNHILTPNFLQKDIILTNGAGVHAIPISEFVLAFMLYHAKNLRKLQTLQDEHTWVRGISLEELADANLLILGTGNIGKAIASRAKAFGVTVWGSRRHLEPIPNFDKIVGVDEWQSLLPAADYVVIATPLTPETKGLIDEAALRSMRQSAYLINIARGAIVDEAALITALREGWIAGAGLDTVATEPLPPESPLWSLPNAFITPHCSALSPRLRERIAQLFIDNLKRYQTGQPLRNVVDKQAGY
ncbi:D-isomer specific 2-hydroxyacid dehydrogenase NAD-binding protein [Nostoc commune NIES-4072]|uniref:D-isomer specific 2-hydroxyacid dehydrogenase NAD-binding protein n=1 Tax=Nostoc commune NIES-4072 TaxID=2005467 RepID=A0A2R5FSI4_NOSCO|nr:D-isomer specific 2-hydroxyacid dehydrogenase NAD-binding protein [Nostoc commune HK-02]GBG18624.1 D-isomer specific 2-hydroxyacid dehydrogenase NAD-binding protein [Nostoc commune NIES-4072]